MEEFQKRVAEVTMKNSVASFVILMLITAFFAVGIQRARVQHGQWQIVWIEGQLGLQQAASLLAALGVDQQLRVGGVVEDAARIHAEQRFGSLQGGIVRARVTQR